MTRYAPLRTERGVALVLTLLLLMLFLSLGAFALGFSGTDSKITANHATGTQALDVAESGLLHALSTMNRIGVTDFNRDVVQQWGSLFTPNPKSVPNAPQLLYQVQVSAGVDPINTGLMTVTATGSNRAQRVIQVRIRRADNPNGRGALYLAADSVNPDFRGAAFEIDGNDHDLAGRLVAGGVVQPGIATRNDAVDQAVTSQLQTNQIPDVRGLGYSTDPPKPSVVASGGPSVTDLNRIISDILGKPGVQTTTDDHINGSTGNDPPLNLGTVANPQITHLTANSVSLNGNISGAGILIADGSVQINGDFKFDGWIIVRGETTINATTNDDTTVLGNATILGALWTGDINVTVGGSAILDYSTGALAIADGIINAGSPVPRPMTVTAWHEVY